MSKMIDVYQFNERFATESQHGKLRMWAIDKDGTPVEVGAQEAE